MPEQTIQRNRNLHISAQAEIIKEQKQENLFGFMTTISEPVKCKLPGIRVDYKKKNLFSTPDTNMLAQISQLSCGRSILDFID